MKSGKGSSKKPSKGFKEISLSLIDHPEEVSRMEIDLDRIKELADSIREMGLLQPILVHPKGERYGVIAGDRRLMAHELLGLKKIMCCIRDISPKDVIIERTVENIQREDLTPFEEAFIYKGLVDKHTMSVNEIATLVGKSPGVVERRLAILKMPDSFQKAIHKGTVRMTVAEELWKCPDGVKREYFLDLASDHGISFRVAREWVDNFKKDLRTRGSGASEGGGNVAPYEDVPIYRACDLCHGAVEYGKHIELRICPGCNESITSALKKQD